MRVLPPLLRYARCKASVISTVDHLKQLLQQRDPRLIAAALLGVVLLGVLIWLFVRWRTPSAEEVERRRRERLAVMGRICDGVIVDARTLNGDLQLRARRLPPWRTRRRLPHRPAHPDPLRPAQPWQQRPRQRKLVRPLAEVSRPSYFQISLLLSGFRNIPQTNLSFPIQPSGSASAIMRHFRRDSNLLLRVKWLKAALGSDKRLRSSKLR